MSEPVQFRRMQPQNSDLPTTINNPSSSESKPLLEKIAFSYLTRLFLLLGLCGFIGIGLPLIWTKIWAPKADLGIESDLRYECLPLRSNEIIKNTTCLVVPDGPCKWDQQSAESEKEIACYYEVEYESSLRSELFPTHSFGKIPRYQVILQNKHDRDQQKKYEPQDNTSIPIPDSQDPNLHYLRLANAPPFLNPDNRNLEKGPVVHQLLTVQVTHYNDNHLRVLIKPYDEDESLWKRPTDYNYPTTSNATSNATVHITPTSSSARHDIFQLQINRNSTGTALFNMGLHTPFIFSKGYMEISTMLVNDIIYGLGQSNAETFRHNFSTPRTWNLFSQYPNPHLKENQTENVTTMWGSHPFYLGIDDPKRGDAYGVLLLNSFPIQVSSNARPSLTFKTHGGHLEFHFFLGPRPADVMRQLQSFIHKPFIPPYWALGFHACSTTCSIPSLSESLEYQITSYGIPLESDCGTAIRRSNANEKSNFERFKDNIKTSGRKYLSIEAPHRSSLSPREPYWKSYSLNFNISNPTAYAGAAYLCNDEDKRIHNMVYYPDVYNAATQSIYRDSNDFHKFADGYILDYNTPLNLLNSNGSLDGICDDMQRRLGWNKWNFGKLNEMGPCLDVIGAFYDKKDQKNVNAYELAPYMALHNMYGFKQAEMIHKIATAENPNHRPLVLSLSTFIGIGRFAGHIGSPIYSNWTSLRLSLKQTLDFSIFGVALSGFPVGGFRGETPKDEVLRRWFQLASVQPFMISYTDFGAEPRSKLKSVREMIRSNVQARYKLLPYLYTLFKKANTDGSLVIAPLFMEFYNDVEVYKINEQFMIGDALLASPVVEEGVTLVKAYFPKGRWYEYYSGHLTSKQDGAHLEISAVEQNINLHIRGGYMVPNHFKTELTIDEMRQKHGFQVIAALDEYDTATGDLYIDDGITPKDGKHLDTHLNIKFDFTYSNITIIVTEVNEFCRRKVNNNNPHLKDINTNLENIKVYGIIEKPKEARVTIKQGTTEADLTTRTKNGELREPDVKYQNNFGVLSISANIDFCDQSKARLFRLNWGYEEM